MYMDVLDNTQIHVMYVDIYLLIYSIDAIDIGTSI